MREIKFRQWDNKNKLMREKIKGRYWTGIESETGKLVFIEEGKIVDVPANRFVIMQYTGLKDKNGKEIYEMDILRVDWGDYPEEYIKVNKYDKPFVMEFRGYEYPPFSRYLCRSEDIEIIGNIYENPELLK